MITYSESMFKNAYKWRFENAPFVNDKEMIFFNDFTNGKNVPRKLNYFIVPSTLQWTINFGHGNQYIYEQTFCKWHFLQQTTKNLICNLKLACLFQFSPKLCISCLHYQMNRCNCYGELGLIVYNYNWNVTIRRSLIIWITHHIQCKKYQWQHVTKFDKRKP
jgi:hypothetical protein